MLRESEGAKGMGRREGLRQVNEWVDGWMGNGCINEWMDR